MQKWEYLTIKYFFQKDEKDSKKSTWLWQVWQGSVPLTIAPDADFYNLAARFGEQGWELVTSTTGATYEIVGFFTGDQVAGSFTNVWIWYFKRPKP